MWLPKKRSTAWFQLCLFQCVTGSMSCIHYRSYHLRKGKTKTERRPQWPRWQSLSTHTCHCCGLSPVIQLLSKFCLCNICPVAPRNKKIHMYYICIGAERGKWNALRLSLSLPCYTSSLPTCSVIRAHSRHTLACKHTECWILWLSRSGYRKLDS